MKLTTRTIESTTPVAGEVACDLVSVEELLELLPGIRRGTLAQWRYEGKGPAYVKVGRRSFYLRSSVDEWLTAHLHVTPSERP
jgi:predicted DNA-binding transcriptional regulator AlpA